MNKFTKLTALGLTALLIGTGLASAGSSINIGDTIPHTESEIGNNIPHTESEIGDNIPHTETVIVHQGVIDAVLGNDKDNKSNKNMLAVKAGELVLKCSAGGHDVLVANAGSVNLPAGTKLNWKVRVTGDKGAATLNKGLAAGQKVKLADVLGGGVAWGTTCSAKVTGL